MKTMKLSQRQAELLERVCLRRYTVRFSHYMGSFSPNEYVWIEAEGDGPPDRSFRPSTAEALREKGLIRFHRGALGHSVLKPTRAGLDLYLGTRGR